MTTRRRSEGSLAIRYSKFKKLKVTFVSAKLHLARVILEQAASGFFASL